MSIQISVENKKKNVSVDRIGLRPVKPATDSGNTPLGTRLTPEPTVPAADGDQPHEDHLPNDDQPQDDQPQDDQPFDDQPFDDTASWSFLLLNAAPSWMFSMLVHVVVLLVLALSQLADRPKPQMQIIGAPVVGELNNLEEFALNDSAPTTVEANEASYDFANSLVSSDVPADVTQVSVANEVDAAPVAIDLMEFGNRTAPKGDLMKQVGSMSGQGIEGRGAEIRGKMVRANGGSEGSEAAVAAALRWFAEHQLPDGGWSFDHRGGLCQGRCSKPGRLADCRTGATAMALLPFLGSGQTHIEGGYKRNVQAGLELLISAMKSNGDLSQPGGSLYSHGLASICLCEAYAMTHDSRLMAPAQSSLNYIVFAQDPIGGGWRYAPKQPGDTSVVGWQLMALKSGHMAKLFVPPATIAGAVRFLDTVQTNGGANYGYTSPGAGEGQTAVGLLCRMYLGWKRDHSGIEKGTDFLLKRGPTDDMYYNYYATQVMRHYGGKKWETWNAQMRDLLVNSQVKRGHEMGSWAIESSAHGVEHGGRMYCTSMATMILEVYYRHMPIYRDQAADEEFPL